MEKEIEALRIKVALLLKINGRKDIEIERCREIAERDGADYANLKSQLAASEGQKQIIEQMADSAIKALEAKLSEKDAEILKLKMQAPAYASEQIAELQAKLAAANETIDDLTLKLANKYLYVMGLNKRQAEAIEKLKKQRDKFSDECGYGETGKERWDAEIDRILNPTKVKK